MLNEWMNWPKVRFFIKNVAEIVEKRRVAVTGWGDGSLYSSAKPNYIRVRMLDTNSEIEVWNDGVPRMKNLQVYVYSDSEDPTILRAKYPSKYYSNDFPFVFTKNHSINHGWYGIDPLPIEIRQILSFQAVPVTAFTLKIRSGWYMSGPHVRHFEETDINLVSHRPATGARYVLVSLAPDTGTIELEDGEVQPTTAALTIEHIPDRQNGSRVICAVRLASSRDSIKDSRVNGDIIDLRFSDIGTISDGSGGGDVSLLPNRLIATDEDGQPVTDSPIWDGDGIITWSDNPEYEPYPATLFGWRIASETSTPGFHLIKASSDANAGAIGFVKYGGTLTAQTAVLNGWRLGSVNFGAHYGTGVDSLKARVWAEASENWSDPNRGTVVKIGATPNGSAVMETVVEIFGDQVNILKETYVVNPDVAANNQQPATTAWTREFAQPKSSRLSEMAGLSPAEGDIMQFRSGAWAKRTLSQLLADLGVVPGKWTPTISLTTNVSSSLTYECTYVRTLDIVSFAGLIRIAATAVGDIIFKMSLPVSSNFSVTNDASGNVTSPGSQPSVGSIIPDVTNKLLDFRLYGYVTTNVFYRFAGQYVIK